MTRANSESIVPDTCLLPILLRTQIPQDDAHKHREPRTSVHATDASTKVYLLSRGAQCERDVHLGDRGALLQAALPQRFIGARAVAVCAVQRADEERSVASKHRPPGREYQQALDGGGREMARRAMLAARQGAKAAALCVVAVEHRGLAWQIQPQP